MIGNKGLEIIGDLIWKIIEKNKKNMFQLEIKK